MPRGRGGHYAVNIIIHTLLNIKWMATVILCIYKYIHRKISVHNDYYIMLFVCAMLLILCVLCSSAVMIREKENSCIHEC